MLATALLISAISDVSTESPSVALVISLIALSLARSIMVFSAEEVMVVANDAIASLNV